MEINVLELSKQQAISTSERKEMRMSDNAQSMVFQLFTKNVYSNPIGTVVREITSNCFDSHVEAKKQNTPVLIRKSFDEQTKTHYISFIDYGVGMSPDRIENIYGVYFESTKRDNNDEIGGFGIGGKTPLAYKRFIGDGESDYDNSFFVITNFDGIKYYYNIFEGAKAPEFVLFHQEETTEANGTEIRIPMLEKDINKFEIELKRQLFYFEGVVFEGFSSQVENDYQIVRGNKFLFRGYGVDNYMHVCLGRVYYPIDYNILGINKFEHEIPVAINVPIGTINVTVSREQLDYSEKTISYLKKRIQEVKDELNALLTKQYDNVRTLEDYFNYDENYGILKLTESKSLNLKSFMPKNTVTLNNYGFKDVKTPGSAALFELFFKVGLYGKRELKKSHREVFSVLTKTYKGIKVNDNTFYHREGELKMPRLKHSYLKDRHGRFYIIQNKDLTHMRYEIEKAFDVTFETQEKFLASKYFKKIQIMQKQYFNIVVKYCEDYDRVEVPEGFSVRYKTSLTKDVLKTTIPVKFYGGYKERVSIDALVNFKGKIFFGDGDDSYEAEQYASMYKALFPKEHLVRGYSKNSPIPFGDRRNIMILTVAKNNLKYFKYCKKAYPLSHFKFKMIARKENEVALSIKHYNFESDFYNIKNIYKSEAFHHAFPEWETKRETIKEFLNEIKINSDIVKHSHAMLNFFDSKIFKLTPHEEKMHSLMKEYKDLDTVNEDALSFINVPYYYNSMDEGKQKLYVDILKKLLCA